MDESVTGTCCAGLSGAPSSNHHSAVHVQCSHNENGGDVQITDSGQSREELQFLVQQLRSEVGALRTELAMVKAGQAVASPPQQEPKAGKEPPGGIAIVGAKPGEKVSSRKLESAIKWPSAGSKSAP